MSEEPSLAFQVTLSDATVYSVAIIESLCPPFKEGLSFISIHSQGRMMNSECIIRKLIDLESSLGLLQRDFEKQNEMLLLDKRRIDQLELAVSRLSAWADSLQIEPARSAIDEKPPHY